MALRRAAAACFNRQRREREREERERFVPVAVSGPRLIKFYG